MMFQFRFQWSCARFLTLLSILSLIFFSYAGVFADTILTAAHQKALVFPEPEPYLTGHERPTEAVADAVCLFTLQNGVCEPQFFTRAELLEGSALESRGYVVGVVVFGPDDLKVQLGNQNFRPIQSNADGTFMVKGYGKIDPADYLACRNNDFRSADGVHTTVTDLSSTRRGSAFYYFSKVFGDAVSPQPTFELQLAGSDSRHVVEVRHRPVQAIDLNSDLQGIASTAFHYVGHRLDLLINQENNFHGRLAAIAEGIRLVEEAFQIDLVQNVQLIDLNQKNNALTHDGNSTIWFYIDTVMGTSMEELRRMASHEALHQLVYRLRLAHGPQVRRFFADLWGLDVLSVARFQMVTTGWFDSQNTGMSPSGGLFFAFINEKNFMHGMHGGHAHDNLDEFLTSFIHSLLYVEKLESNLQAPVKSYDASTVHVLTEAEKIQLVTLYRQGIDLLIQTAGTTRPDQLGQGKQELVLFLKERLASVERISPQG
ncbi:MAG: hypothetical protein C4519_07110 [Desulfobacteraceae bacterium]|nr:MAG: hypothetical protein C4519_07110 [Desulfobacteraceae bacterium]